MAKADGEGGWSAFLETPGLWVQLLSDPVPFDGRPALFLDRDGTLNADTGYPRRADEIVLLPDILPLVRAANVAGIAAVIVSNQSGIARGLLGWAEFAGVNARLLELLGREGCRIDIVLACAYHGEGVEPYRRGDHPMRKPNPGMLLRAAELAGLDLAASVMVGDKKSDVEAGRRAGLSRNFLLPDRPDERQRAIEAAIGEIEALGPVS